MRTALTTLLLLGWVASGALAQTSPPPASKGPDAAAQPQADTRAGTGKKDAPKAPDARAGKEVVTDSLASCLAMWDRATHMSKQEWARACRRVDDRLRNIGLQ